MSIYITEGWENFLGALKIVLGSEPLPPPRKSVYDKLVQLIHAQDPALRQWRGVLPSNYQQFTAGDMEAYGKQGVNSGSQILSFYPGITYFDGTNIRNEYGIFYSIQCYFQHSEE
jgi:hypothetical protein